MHIISRYLFRLRSLSTSFLFFAVLLCRNPKVSSYHDELQFAPYLPSHGPVFLESKPGNQYRSSYSDKPNIVTHELVSPRTDTERFAGQVHNRPPYGSNWSAAGSAEMMEARPSFSGIVQIFPFFFFSFH